MSTQILKVDPEIQLDSTSLYFAPMGGCGEIGMNASFYGCQDEWIMVDCGVIFSRIPDAVLMAEIRHFLALIQKKPKALILTHAHEDHFGAVVHLWHELRCPIYATPFTAFLLREKLKSARMTVPVIEVPLGGSIEIEPFGIRFVSLTHSIPEPNALAITTPFGIVFHTGDWKLDPDPMLGADVDFKALKEIGDTENVLAMVCDSTNVFEEGSSGSELDVQKELVQYVSECTTGIVVVACFASNAARVKSAYEAAKANGRKVMLAGRSLLRIQEAASACGYFGPDMEFIPPEQAVNLPREKLLVICTGSQAEPKAALTRMVHGDHPFIKLDEGDTVIFSSRVIPGNEEGIAGLKNQLTRWGICIKDAHDFHVSGHPYRDELKAMYELIRPKIAVPVHGEDRHIHEHAAYAADLGIPAAITPHNGEIYRLAPELEYVGSVDKGRLMVDGKRLIDVHGLVMQERWGLLQYGIVFLSIMASRPLKKMTSAQITSYGVAESRQEANIWEPKIHSIIRKSLPEEMTPADRGLESHLVRQIGSYFYTILGKKPIIKVQISWI